MALNVFQEVTLISSLVTNILGTGLISLKAWYAWGSQLGKAVILLSLRLAEIGGIEDGSSRISNV